MKDEGCGFIFSASSLGLWSAIDMALIVYRELMI
jgi:hypothetical protein